MFEDDDETIVVATTAHKHPIPDIQFPKHFIITDYIPAEAILSKNCQVSIIHGGRGSLYHALQKGVPILGIPHQGEQEWNLDAIERLKVGKKLSAKTLSIDIFREALTSLLVNPMYQRNAQEFSKHLLQYSNAAIVIAEKLNQRTQL
ncbi:MAG: glycosyltransferase, partial [Candidatus Dojkabacteria bacterium]